MFLYPAPPIPSVTSGAACCQVSGIVRLPLLPHPAKSMIPDQLRTVPYSVHFFLLWHCFVKLTQVSKHPFESFVICICLIEFQPPHTHHLLSMLPFFSGSPCFILKDQPFQVSSAFAIPLKPFPRLFICGWVELQREPQYFLSVCL